MQSVFQEILLQLGILQKLWVLGSILLSLNLFKYNICMYNETTTTVSTLIKRRKTTKMKILELLRMP